MYRILFLLFALYVTGCTIDDEDRCPGGYVYNTEYKACEEEDTSSGDADSDSDADADADADTDVDADGGSGDGGDEKESGLGEACEESADCEDYVADYCAVNPISGTGYCTTKDCPANGDCESGYVCCDCAGSAVLPKEKACLTEEDATLAGGVGGCICS